MMLIMTHAEHHVLNSLNQPDRSVWTCHPLELSPDDALVEDGRLSRSWKHRRDQASPGKNHEDVGEDFNEIFLVARCPH